jgi:deazaflavin-dependent oxidoreductase (nitroreductase family)
MNVKPNVVQKFIHQFLMLGPVTSFFAPRIHQADKAILKLTMGKHPLSEIADWNIIQLRTIGAKTAQARTLPLIALFDGEKIVLIASSFGRSHNPGWYYKLKAHPECDVQYNDHSGKYIAHEAEEHEREKYWPLAVLYYAGYEKYRERATHRQVLIMVLEPKKQR